MGARASSPMAPRPGAIRSAALWLGKAPGLGRAKLLEGIALGGAGGVSQQSLHPDNDRRLAEGGPIAPLAATSY